MMEKDFKVKLVDGTLMIKLGLELTAYNAEALLDELMKFYGQDIKKVIFDASQLAFLASAGIRVIFYAYTKLGCEPDLVFVNCEERIKEVLDHIGMSQQIKFEENEEIEKKYRNDKLISDGMDALKQEAKKRKEIIDDFTAHNDVVCYSMKLDQED